jgi:hypothetical protein
VNAIRRATAAAIASAAALPGRARHGRPLRITARAAIAAAAALLAARVIPGTPAAPAIQAGAALWFALTLPPDLAPPPTPSQDQP